jgi:1,4-dihydroxy-2-naphthoate octaprenyltransferase
MKLRQLWGIVELKTKVVSVSTLATATLFALRERGRLDLLGLALIVPAVLLVDMGTTAFNSFFDYWRGEDRGGRLREPDKVLVTEGVPALAALFVALGCFLAAACLGLALAFHAGAWLLWAGAICLAAGYSYNGGPLRISRSPLGELVAGAFLGTFLFLIVYRVQAGGWGTRPLLASIPGALFIASILAVNNACDIEGDTAAGRKTLAILLGARRASALPFALGAAAFALGIGLAFAGPLPRASALCLGGSAIAAMPFYARMIRRGFSHETKGPSMRAILGAFGVWSLGYVLGLLL